MEPSKNPDPFYASLEDEAILLYHPGSRDHAREWIPDPAHGHRRFVGVSSLVKHTAKEYAAYILAAKDEVDENEGFFGEQGNALAEHHLKQLTPYRENQVRIILKAICSEHPSVPVIPRYAQLDDPPQFVCDHQHTLGEPTKTPCNAKTTGWDMVGHFDGVTVHEAQELGIIDEQTDFRLVLREHKHQDPDDGEPGGNVDKATRQALTYSGIIDEMFDMGACFMLPSSLMTQGCRLAPVAPVAGMVLHFWSRTSPPASVKARPLEKWEKVKMLDFYKRKAEAVIKAVETGDLSHAIAWDDSPEGVQEFKRTITAIQAGLPTGPFRDLVLEVHNAKKARDQWDVLARDREASAVALMTQRDVRTLMVTEDDGKTEVARVTIVGGNGRSSYLKITPRGPKATTAASVPETASATTPGGSA